MGITFTTNQIQAKQATSRQKKYVRNLLKSNPTLGEPADWSSHTIRTWLDRASEALGPSMGHSSSSLSHPELARDQLLRDICGDPIRDTLRDEMRSCLADSYY